MKAPNLIGLQFGRLTVVARAENSKSLNSRWVCLCECGGEKVAERSNLRRGHVSNCGCLAGHPTHGESNWKNDGRTKEYRAWLAMRERCNDPNHISYCYHGGRGITVCDQWLESFENFLADVGRAPSPEYSIDRRDVNGNYEPGNVRWATRSEQRRNRRDSVKKAA